MCLDESQIPASTLENERSIRCPRAESGKPAEIVKDGHGRIRKFVGEVTLLGQPFVKDPDQSVEKFLKGAGATVSSYERLEVGEGIEKKSENFAEEVMSQVKASDRCSPPIRYALTRDIMAAVLGSAAASVRPRVLNKNWKRAIWRFAKRSTNGF